LSSVEEPNRKLSSDLFVVALKEMAKELYLNTASVRVFYLQRSLFTHFLRRLEATKAKNLNQENE